MFGKPRSPEKILKDVEIYLADINVPNYAAIQALEKGINEHPENIELKQKLKELKTSKDINISQSTPKTMYGVLVIAISLMGVFLIASYLTNQASSLALFLGVSFIGGALVIFNQYKKEK